MRVTEISQIYNKSNMISVIDTIIDGVKIIEPKIFSDDCDYFYESFSQRNFDAAMGMHVQFVQENLSFSHYGVLRGLHFQNPPYSQSKLVQVLNGNVLNVAVDIRKGSPTYGKHVAVELTGDNHRQLFIPKGFAHGFLVLSGTALFQYKCDQFYHPESEGSIAWNDQALDIDWPIQIDKMVLNVKDAHHQYLKDFDTPFFYKESKASNSQINLRPITIEDGKNIVKWRNDPKIKAHCKSKNDITIETNEIFFHTMVETGKYKQFIVEYKNPDFPIVSYPIATVYLKDMDYKNKCCELCIFTSNDYEWDSEMQQVAISMLIDKAFNEYGMLKIYSYVYYKFPDEIKLLNNAGLVIESTLKDGSINENGEKDDIALMSIVKFAAY